MNYVFYIICHSYIYSYMAMYQRVNESVLKQILCSFIQKQVFYMASHIANITYNWPKSYESGAEKE